MPVAADEIDPFAAAIDTSVTPSSVFAATASARTGSDARPHYRQT
jgi:hypothetical protein